MFAVFAELLIMFTFASEPSPALWRSLTHEIEHTQIDNVCWRIAREQTPQATPSVNIAFTVEVQGKCEPLQVAVPWRPEPLGWVEFVNGEWLPQVHIDCTRIAEALGHGGDVPLFYFSELAMARAMATVVRHELHHLLRQTSQHSLTGEFRATLNGRDLVLPFAESKCPR